MPSLLSLSSLTWASLPSLSRLVSSRLDLGGVEAASYKNQNFHRDRQPCDFGSTRYNDQDGKASES